MIGMVFEGCVCRLLLTPLDIDQPSFRTRSSGSTTQTASSTSQHSGLRNEDLA